jgi:hypothetical protein
MAYHRRGQTDDTNQWLAKGLAAVDKRMAQLAEERKVDNRAGLLWEQRELQLLRQEAETLIKPKTNPPK